MSSSGVIEDAVVEVLMERGRRIRLNIPLQQWWESNVIVSDEVGYNFQISDRAILRFIDLGFTELVMIETLVTFIFHQMEQDLGYNHEGNNPGRVIH